jgi:hypothetical protein
MEFDYYTQGCGTAARFCDSRTCQCAWPDCDGFHHVCMCGADWHTGYDTMLPVIDATRFVHRCVKARRSPQIPRG